MKFFKELFKHKPGTGDTDPSVIISGSVIPIEEPESGETMDSGETVSEKETGSTAGINEIEVITPEPEHYDANFHVLLDNGHASTTPGKRQQLTDGKYFYEYEYNRKVVKKISEKLDAVGISYEILVPEVDKDISLSDRASRANSFCTKYGTNNCFFISVHGNAFGDGKTFTSAKGWCIYTTKGADKSDEYATILYDVANEILPKYGMTTRKDSYDGDPDYEENFTVIYKTWCPAVLTENLFFTNKEEVAWMMTEEGVDAIAEIHVEGIKRIIESRK